MKNLSFLYLYLLNPIIVVGIFLMLPGSVLAAGLELSPDSGSYTQGDIFTVDVELTLDAESVDGVDALLEYDSQDIEVIRIDDGDLFNDIIKNFDADSGTISISGLNTSNPVETEGVIATLVLKGIAAGTSELTFDYTSGSRIDSNVAEHQTSDDILTSVTDASFSIVSISGTGGTDDTTNSDTNTNNTNNSTSTTTNSGVGGTTKTPSAPTLPQAGHVENMIALLSIGAIALSLGAIVKWQWLRKGL